VGTSREVLKGKIAEQLAPLLPGFLAKYNPADARFIGSPIDYLIFRNMNKRGRIGRPDEIVLLNAKKEKSGLNGVQKNIDEAAAEKRIRLELLRIDKPSRSSVVYEESSEQLKLGEDPAEK
jgi:predicted Holliday junction resolvase-like endonuclease